MKESCDYTPLHEDENCALDRCVGCGKIKLSLGVVTLTFTPTQLAALTHALQQAQSHLDAETLQNHLDATQLH